MISLSSTKELTREQWLEMRRNGIGGSDAASILGLNPWSSPLTVYMDKLGLSDPADESEAMWLGNVLEQPVAARFAAETGMTVQRRNAIYQHPYHPWMIANIDRWIVGKRAGLEIKTTNMLSKTDFTGGDMPPHYYCQCLHYMAVTGADEWYLAVLVVNRGFHVLKIERNEDEITALIEAERKFWHDHVLARVPPAPDGSAAAAEIIKSLYPASKGDGILVPLYGRESEIEQLQDIKERIKGLEAQSDEIEQRIQMEIGEADGAIMSGYKISWKSQSRSTIDSKRLQKDKPEVYKNFLKTSTFRKFEIKREKGVQP